MESYIFLLCFAVVVSGSWVKEMENPGMYEGDMVLTPEQQQLANNGKLGYASTYKRLWPKTIYYDWSPDLANNRGILAAMADYEAHTCLKFVKRTNELNYMYFFKGSGCYSGVGYYRLMGKHYVSIGKWCDSKGTVLHEIAHRLGIYHEQSRPDRDDYVTIMTQNIYPKMVYNFRKQKASNIDSYGTNYDLLSIMHYPDWAFSKNGKPTIVTKDPSMQKVIGNRRGFSKIDIVQINRMYKCGSVPTIPPKDTTTKPKTFPTIPPKVTTMKPNPDCKDVREYSFCSKEKRKCKGYGAGWTRYMKKYCLRTCSYC